MKKIIIPIICCFSVFTCFTACTQNLSDESETLCLEISNDTEKESEVSFEFEIEVSKNEGGRYGGGRGNSSAPAL